MIAISDKVQMLRIAKELNATLTRLADALEKSNKLAEEKKDNA
jgi:hypothetical protein